MPLCLWSEVGQWLVVVKGSKLWNLVPAPGLNCGRHHPVSSSGAWYMTCSYLPVQGGCAAWWGVLPSKLSRLHCPCFCRWWPLCLGACACALSCAGGREPKRHPYRQCCSWCCWCRRRRRRRCRCRCCCWGCSRWGCSRCRWGDNIGGGLAKLAGFLLAMPLFSCAARFGEIRTMQFLCRWGCQFHKCLPFVQIQWPTGCPWCLSCRVKNCSLFSEVICSVNLNMIFELYF